LLDSASQYDVQDRVFAGFARDYGQWDASLSYELAENLNLTFQAVNITGEDQSSYLEYPNQFFTFASGEMRLFGGVSFRF